MLETVGEPKMTKLDAWTTYLVRVAYPVALPSKWNPRVAVGSIPAPQIIAIELRMISGQKDRVPHLVDSGGASVVLCIMQNSSDLEPETLRRGGLEACRI